MLSRKLVLAAYKRWAAAPSTAASYDCPPGVGGDSETASDAARLVEAHRQLAELDLGAGCFDDAGRHLESAAELAGKSLAASEAASCWLAYADYLANRLLVRKAREAIAFACRFAEKSGHPP